MKRGNLEQVMGWNPPKKCPLCGRGISAKYRDKPHPHFTKRGLRRWMRSMWRGRMCPWTP